MNAGVRQQAVETVELPVPDIRKSCRAQKSAPWTIDTPPSSWSIGRVAPLLLAAWALLDVSLRFAPLGWLNLEPAQVATRTPGRFSPFIPNLHVEMNPWIGELALLGNLPPMETRSPVTFTTDSLGFRNLNSLSPSGPRLLVMEGDSFTFGFSLSDDETFPAVLSRQLGVPVYNAGRFVLDPERLLEMDWLIARIKKGPLTIIYVLQELPLPSLDKQHDQKAYDKLGRKLIGADIYTPLKDELRYAKRFIELWSRISPLRITATRAYKALNNDRILPNAYRKNVVERQLPNNGRFLIDREHLAQYLNPPDDEAVRQATEYLAWLQRQFANRGLDFWVLMVPEAVSVYGPWLFERETERLHREGKTPLFDRVERALVSRNVRAVNGLAVLRSLATEDIATRHLSYYRDDHHWNVQGVTRLAASMAAALRQAGVGQQR